MENFQGQDGFVWFTGVVEDRNDPTKLGRVRVRCVGYHTADKTKIPTEDLPWAWVMQNVHTPAMAGWGDTPGFIVEGSWVVGFFRDAETLQEPIVIGTLPGVPNQAGNPNFGFHDPRRRDEDPEKEGYNISKYPPTPLSSSDHSINESDVNRLARNETVTWEGEDVSLAHSILNEKELNRTKKVPVANASKSIFEHEKPAVSVFADTELSEGWDEPKSTYAAVYPNNNVRETYGKNIKEYDDTDGATRIHEIHGQSGTFYEIDHSGNKVTRIVGDNYEIVAGNNYVNLKGEVFLTIDNSCNTYIKGNWNIQVDGNVVENIKGTYDQNVTGDATMDAKTINLNSGTKGAARLDDQVDTGDDPAGISGSDGSNKIESASKTVIIGD